MEPSNMARSTTGLAGAVLVAGLALALAYSAAEALGNSGYSLADGYWRGALPWMGIIEGLVVAGATGVVLAGTATVAILDGWARLAVALVAATITGVWWLMAVIGAGMGGAACVDCPPSAPDPWSYAYSAPLLAMQMLIVPAAVIALLALGRRTAG